MTTMVKSSAETSKMRRRRFQRFRCGSKNIWRSGVMGEVVSSFGVVSRPAGLRCIEFCRGDTPRLHSNRMKADSALQSKAMQKAGSQEPAPKNEMQIRTHEAQSRTR